MCAIILGPVAFGVAIGLLVVWIFYLCRGRDRWKVSFTTHKFVAKLRSVASRRLSSREELKSSGSIHSSKNNLNSQQVQESHYNETESSIIS
jgi:hypothetical protein